MENETQVQNQDNTVVVKQTQTNNENEPVKESEKTFTQDDVNNIVVGRLSSIYKGYGVKDKAELDLLVQKANGFDELKTNFDSLSIEHQNTKDKLVFLENNINPERYDDVKAYFKGKEIVFNAENLIKEIETHKEWLNVPKSTFKVGNVQQEQISNKTDKERAMELFGF